MLFNQIYLHVNGNNNSILFNLRHIKKVLGNKQRLWSGSRALGSQSEGRGFNPHPMLDGSGVRAMNGSIPTHPILVQCRKNKKIQVAKWGTPKKYLKRKKRTSGAPNLVKVWPPKLVQLLCILLLDVGADRQEILLEQPNLF